MSTCAHTGVRQGADDVIDAYAATTHGVILVLVGQVVQESLGVFVSNVGDGAQHRLVLDLRGRLWRS